MSAFRRIQAEDHRLFDSQAFRQNERRAELEKPNLEDHQQTGAYDGTFNLLDGATGVTIEVVREVDQQRKISTDASLTLK
jgi:hypothetical protein